ncbi:MAG: hypothetical protein WDM90_07790 [Ferruginibacter sp.]
MKNKKQQRITHPITNKEEVAKNPDHKIDEDFKGFPHAPSTEKMIKPSATTEKKVAAINSKDGEKRNYKKR